jgi:phenylpropionate dioxygenase-like ring-hydroxylating dioxygenase large terminal subunit
LEHPELGTGPLSIEPYISPKYFDAMRDKVFRKVWICTGRRTQDIPSPGDYLVFELEMLGVSLIIVRGLDGVIRAHHNVCMHRGNKLTMHSRGTCKGRLVCGYHGWAYGLDGKLMTVTEEEMFFSLDKKSLNLRSVAVDSWAGFIFVNMNPQPEETLKEYIGPITDLFAGYPFDDLPVSWSYTAKLKSCWAVARDSQLEGYHLKYLHKRTSPGVMSHPEDPNRHSLDFKLLGRHAVGSYFGARSESALPPVAKLAASISQTLGSTASALSDVNTWPKGLNPTRNKDWFFDIVYIFPNFHVIFIGASAYAAHTFMPVTAGTCTWNARAYLPAPRNLLEQFARECVKTAVRDLWLEDGSTLEGTQRNIESGVLRSLQIQDQEVLIRHATKTMNEMIGNGE